MNNRMTGAEFIAAMYENNCWSNGPEPMTEDDAAYNLDCYRTVDKLDIPRTVTPHTFCAVWNLLYKRDMTHQWKAVVEA